MNTLYIERGGGEKGGGQKKERDKGSVRENWSVIGRAKERYRVFIKCCVLSEFFIIENIPDSGLSLFSPAFGK